MTISGDDYRRIGRAAAGSVSVVTTRDRSTNEVVGLTVSSFVTLSFDPPLVMFAIQHDASSYPSIVASQEFGVSLLDAQQADIARRFAVKGVNKGAGTDMEIGLVLPVPLIAWALAHVECRTSQIVVSGDHAIVVGLVEAARARDGDPLLYFARNYGTFTPLSGS
jgi:4-nitrophenol 2-monooxygenase / 4-nitrocatechol 4-monooxygenase, reductase component